MKEITKTTTRNEYRGKPQIRSPEQQRAMMIQLLTPAGISPVAVPSLPKPQPETTAATISLKKKKLEIEYFSGAAGENYTSQVALYGEEWSSEDLFFGVSAHLKDAARKWFIKLSSEIPPHCRTMEYLSRKLQETYGSQENVWEIEFKLMKRQQQPGELLRDFANCLDEIGAGHTSIPTQCYVDVFIRGMNNEVMSQSVRTAGVQTLEQAVNYAVRNCGKYGQGCEITD
ncbi:putative Polyprotein [Phytophthora palmivora]|uniref:Polyprotein n=1 Tax=Phytophthora palmivora TaxID=4796 RepID=A0A2P4WZC1_9STRA|nr:putative Polyprotein [Phytophthora palmivora]